MTDKKEEAKQPTDEQILFPEVTVEADGNRYLIKPWSFGKLLEVNPVLEEIMDKLEAKGTSVDPDNLDVGFIKNVYFAAMPQVIKLLTLSIDITEEDAKELTVQGALTLAMSVFMSNLDSFKSFFNLFFNPLGISLEGPGEEVEGQV